jgi:hypothetical protein
MRKIIAILLNMVVITESAKIYKLSQNRVIGITLQQKGRKLQKCFAALE